MAIQLRSAEELEKMYRAGLIVHEILTELREMVRPGLTTMDLEKFAEEKSPASRAKRRSRDTAIIPARCALR